MRARSEASTCMSKPVIVVVGAGPGVSGSVARRFADEGYDVGLLGQDQQVLDQLVTDLGARGATVGHAVRRRHRRAGGARRRTPLR